MKTGIEYYGLLWLFAFTIICVPQLMGLAITYKQVNEMSSLIVEVIEVHDGLNENAKNDIKEINNTYRNMKIEIDQDHINDKNIYYIDTSKEFSIALLNLSFDVKANKITKGVSQ